MNNEERTPCEVFSRVVGYLRPITQWNKGKKEEFYDRTSYKVDKELDRIKKEKQKET